MAGRQAGGRINNFFFSRFSFGSDVRRGEDEERRGRRGEHYIVDVTHSK